jgi:hypothetical protein
MKKLLNGMYFGVHLLTSVTLIMDDVKLMVSVILMMLITLSVHASLATSPNQLVKSLFLHSLRNLDLKACMEQCLRNCSCTAYASSVVTSKSGCFSWYGNLLDTRVFAEGGQDLYVRVDAFELGTFKSYCHYISLLHFSTTA